MMIKLKDLQAQQQKQQEKTKQSVHDPMPSSILHPQQNPTSSKLNLNTALLLGEQQPPNISMISDMLPDDYSSSTNKSNGKNSNPKIKQRKVYNTVFLVLLEALFIYYYYMLENTPEERRFEICQSSEASLF